MKLLVVHTTRYLYSEEVSLCHSEVHLAPRPCATQTVLRQELQITPGPGEVVRRKDYFGNETDFFSIEEPHRELVITSSCLAELAPSPPPNLDFSPPWEQVMEQATAGDGADPFEARKFVFGSPCVPVGEPFAAYAAKSFTPGRPFLEAANDLARRIFSEFRYDKRATTVATPVDEVLRSRRGVCQDFAHLMIACLRSLRLPARYVSGYVRTGKQFVGEEASHAWVSLWCPVFGWTDFDPTNNVMPHNDHFTVAWGRDYSDVTPVKGVALGGGEHVISVSVDVSSPSAGSEPADRL